MCDRSVLSEWYCGALVEFVMRFFPDPDEAGWVTGALMDLAAQEVKAALVANVLASSGVTTACLEGMRQQMMCELYGRLLEADPGGKRRVGPARPIP
jgi:hypothetical protein